MRSLHDSGNDGQNHRPMIAIFFGILIVYLITRMVNLLGLPIFTDEAEYIQWSQIIAENHSNFKFTLTIGRQPLFHWVNAITLILLNDPLLSARIISVIAGLFTIVGIFLVCNQLYSPLTGALAALLYCVIPYTLFFDRIAHVDSLLTMFSTFALLLSINLSRTFPKKKRLFVYLGAVLGLGFITKTPALSYFVLPPIVIYLIGSPGGLGLWVYLAMSYAITVFIILWTCTGVTAQMGTNILLHQASYFMTISDLLSIPYLQWAQNVKIIINYLSAYMTLPILLFLIPSIVILFIKQDRKGMALAIWFIFPIVLLAVVGKVLYSRYILFCIPPAIIITANSLMVLKEKIKPYIGTAALISGFMLMITPAVLLSFKIVTDPANAVLLPEDEFQYISGWPSGYGLPEAIRYLKSEAKQKPITVLTTNLSGNPSDAILIGLKGEQNITAYEAWWWDKSPIIPDNMDFADTIKSKYQKWVIGKIQFKALKDVYFVTDSSRHESNIFLHNNRNLIKIVSFLKPRGITSIDIYKLNR